jgi:hypothetical protein
LEELPDKPAGTDAASSMSVAKSRVGGSVIQGSNNVAVSTNGTTNIYGIDFAPAAARRPGVVDWRPRRRPPLIGRDAQLAQAREALIARAIVACFGEAGIGKTALIGQLAWEEFAYATDGVVFIECHNQSVDAALQRLVRAFYDTHGRAVTTDGEYREYLGEIDAVVVLDDADFAREDFERLVNAAPKSTFLCAASRRRFWGESRAIGLGGLEREAALRLLGEWIPGGLRETDHDHAVELWRALGGHPLRLIQVAGLAADGAPPSELWEIAGHPFPERELAERLRRSLSPEEVEVLALLAAAESTLHVDAIGAMMPGHDAPALLEELERRGLVRSHSPRYDLAGSLAEEIDLKLKTARTTLLRYTVDTLERGGDDAEQLLEDSGAAAAIASWAVRQSRGREAVRIARAAGAPLALSGRWAEWERMLRVGLEGAARADDAQGLAWAWNQLGVIEACRGAAGAAAGYFEAARTAYQACGNTEAAGAMARNLAYVKAPVRSRLLASAWSSLLTGGAVFNIALTLIVMAGVLWAAAIIAQILSALRVLDFNWTPPLAVAIGVSLAGVLLGVFSGRSAGIRAHAESAGALPQPVGVSEKEG